MSDDKRREELKAEINEKLDQLSVEDLEKVAGGWLIRHDYDPYDDPYDDDIPGTILKCSNCGGFKFQKTDNIFKCISCGTVQNWLN
ncbi:MAG: hypothetical protein IJ608_14350 [Lachnospiraceae bacterium]|nr:hypothetical protein [Lachnospiraceae bacterium]